MHPVHRLLRAFVFLLALSFVSAARAQVGYDLSGDWLLIGIDVQQSFCDGSERRAVVVLPVTVSQLDESVSLALEDGEVLTGRTANLFLAAEALNPDASTLLSARIAPGATFASGTLVFFDKHACPEAETGQGPFLLLKLG